MARIVTLTLNPALDISTATPSVRPTHKLRCTTPRREPGGGGINVARVVHALGGDVTAVLPCGGPTGEALKALLDQAGLRMIAVPVAGETRESLTVDAEDSRDQYRFVLPGAELSPAEIEALLDTVANADPPPRYVVASGSLPPGCDPAIFARLCKLCSGIGARLVVDTSGPPLAALEDSCAFLIKPSLREVEELVGRELPDEAAEIDAARELVGRGFADVVVISLAERGALLAAGDGTALRLPAIDVPEGSAVGAGDAMVAALVVALDQERGLAEVLRYGVAAGAAALITPGSELARREDVERLYAASADGSAQNRS